MRERDKGSVLWRHSCLKHGGVAPLFTMNITWIFYNDAMLRQITESVRIGQVKENKLINTKAKWNYFPIPRTIINYCQFHNMHFKENQKAVFLCREENASLLEHACQTNYAIGWNNSKIITTSWLYRQCICLEAWDIK